jgi:hypothetical protein
LAPRAVAPLAELYAAPTPDQVKNVMRAILASVPDGVVGVHYATIYARAALEEMARQAAPRHNGTGR